MGVLSVLAALVDLERRPGAAAAERPSTTIAASFRSSVYHGIDVVPRPGEPYSITQAEFARQMAMLARDGFHAISIAQYARFAGGESRSSQTGRS